MQAILLSIVFSSIGVFLPSAHAYLPDAKMPACLDGPDEMKIDNARVLKFKTTTRNQYLDRGFVEGKVTKAPGVKNDHDHFVIAIGPNAKDTLEIIYNKEFGAMPTVSVGDKIVVCGDYITSNAPSGRYDASPEGAIIHWVHFNPGTRASSATHEHGFIMVNSHLIGFDEAPEGDWNGRIVKTPQPDSRTRTGSYPKEGEAVPQDRDDQRFENQNASTQRKPRNSPQVSRRRDDRRDDRQRPTRWKPCRSLDECRERNR